MPSKKPTSAKRPRLPRRYEFERQFGKDWDKLTRAGRYDMTRLKEVMSPLIMNDGPLPAEFKDHPLSASGKEAAIAKSMATS